VFAMAISVNFSTSRAARYVDPRVFGLLLTVVCLALGAYAVSWPQTFSVIAAANLELTALSTICLLVTLCAFALRWRQLIAVEKRPPPARIFNLLMIGYLANAILPARPGDVIRAVLLRQTFGISLSYGLASIVLERLFDALAICGLGLITSFVVPMPPFLLSGLYVLGAAGLAVTAILSFLNWRRMAIAQLPIRFPLAFRHPLTRFFAQWLERFASAMRILYSPVRLSLAVLLTCLGWGTLALSSILLIQAFQVPAPPAAALLVLVATNLGAVVPSSPGSVGVYHVMAVMALSVWQVDTSVAVAFAIASHALAVGLHIVLGLCCAWFEGIGVRRLTRLAEATD
jgi:uncharacterized protein (TIRG00374 family)